MDAREPLSNDNTGRYLRQCAALVFGLLATIAVATWFFDPLGVFAIAGYRNRQLDNATAWQAGMGLFPLTAGNREAKILNSYYYRPQTLVFGSSNVWSYIDVSQQALIADDGRYAYNFGLAGLSAFELEELYNHVLALRKPDLIVVSLEFFMFNGARQLGVAVDDFALAHRPGWHRQMLANLLRKSLGYESLLATTAALGRAGERSARAVARALLGRDAHASSAEKLVALRNVDIAQVSALYQPSIPFSFANADGRTSFDVLAGMLKAARRDGVPIKLFLSPHHVRTFEIIRALGLWSDYEAWLRGLAQLVAEANQGRACAEQIPLLDFGSYRAANIEDLLSDDQQAGFFPNYYDSFHFRVPAGNMIVETLGSWRCGELAAADGPATSLTPDNVDAYLSAVAARRARFAATNPGLVAEVAEVVAAIRARN